MASVLFLLFVVAVVFLRQLCSLIILHPDINIYTAWWDRCCDVSYKDTTAPLPWDSQQDRLPQPAATKHTSHSLCLHVFLHRRAAAPHLSRTYWSCNGFKLYQVEQKVVLLYTFTSWHCLNKNVLFCVRCKTRLFFEVVSKQGGLEFYATGHCTQPGTLIIIFKR